MDKLVETKNLYVDFNTFEGSVKALNGVSITVYKGETYGLVGESGCGKSVTVRSMMKIVQSPGKIRDGEILLFFDDKEAGKAVDLLKQNDTYVERIRGNDISMIFQEANASLNPVFTILEQVEESFLLHRKAELLEETIKIIENNKGEAKSKVLLYEKAMLSRELKNVQKRSKSRLYHILKHFPFLNGFYKKFKLVSKTHVIELLTSLGIPNPENIIKRYPHELSGGMQQRIVIAIALACHPTLLIADEPTSNLDVTIQAQILELIRELKKERITSVIFITHDLGVVAEICDRVTVMYAGDVMETAEVNEIFLKPLHPYTKGLINSVPKEEQAKALETIPGMVPNLIHAPSGCRFHPRCPHVMDKCRIKKPDLLEVAEGHVVACYLYSQENKKK